MSVSNIVSSFSPTAFFKVGGEILHHFNRPSTVLAVGACIGITTCLIKDIQRVNREALGHNLKQSIEKCTKMVLNTWLAACVLAYAGLVWPHRSFVVLTAVSSGMLFIFLRGIKGQIEKEFKHNDVGLKTKLAEAANRAFRTLIPTAAVTTMLLFSAYVQTLEQKV